MVQRELFRAWLTNTLLKVACVPWDPPVSTALYDKDLTRFLLGSGFYSTRGRMMEGLGCEVAWFHGDHQACVCRLNVTAFCQQVPSTGLLQGSSV